MPVVLTSRAGGSDPRLVVAALNAVQGAPLDDDEPPHWMVATADAIRHFARSYGDDHPRYSDPAYAAAGPYRQLIAPPLFPLSSGTPRRAPGAGGAPTTSLPGAPDGRIEAERWTLHRPVTEGAALWRERTLGPAAHDPAETAGRPSYLVVERTVWGDGHGRGPVSTRERSRRYWLAGRPPAPGPPPERARYGDDDLAAIESACAAYAAAADARRAAGTRRAAEVTVGDRLGPMVKGPLTVTDLVDYRQGVGAGPLGGEPLALAWRNRQTRPWAYDRDDTGAYDNIERRHYDDAYARSLGFPGAYDYSHTRLVWLSHLLTDWMGDGAHLYALSGTTGLGANSVGDTHWLDGEVTAVVPGAVARAADRVEVAVAGTNQRGEVTCRATAVVLLPAEGADRVDDGALAAAGALDETAAGGTGSGAR